MEHCRPLFETRCRLVKPLLLSLSRSGRCAFPGVQGCRLSPRGTASARRLCPRGCASPSRSRVRQRAGGKGPWAAGPAGSACSAQVLPPPPAEPRGDEPTLFSMWEFETTASITTYGIFPYVVKPSHLSIVHFKVFTCFNPELFDSAQTLYSFPFHH